MELNALDETLRRLLWARYSWAYDLCYVLAPAPEGMVLRPDLVDRDELFLWLTVESWEAGGYGAIGGMLWSAPFDEPQGGIAGQN